MLLFWGLFLLGVVGLVIFGVVGLFVLMEIPALIVIGSFFLCCGFFTNPPNTAVVLMYCQKYQGTVRENGYFWVNPFYKKTIMSLRAQTLNSPIVEVNDKMGSPIRVGCVVVWRIKECTKALFHVNDYHYYVRDQLESSIRILACKYRYDKKNEDENDDEICLRTGHEIINKELQHELGNRLRKAGLLVEEARITEIKYAPEVANSMLQRQAAESNVGAKEKIVSGAAHAIQQAVAELESNNACKLTPEAKSNLVSNMMIMLCANSEITHVMGNNSQVKGNNRIVMYHD